MATELKMKLLFRRDTAEHLKAAFTDKFLAPGEPVYETDTGLFKIGDGKTAYSALPFANEAQIKALIKEVDDKFADYYLKTEVDNAHNAINTAINNINTAIGKLGDTYATDAELADAVKDLEAADTAIENKIGADSDAATADTVYGAIAAEKVRAEGVESGLDSRLDTAEGKISAIQGDGDGSINKALADAKAYTDGVKSGLETSISNEAAAREQADTALSDRVKAAEDKLANVSNVMDFVGQRTVTVVDGVITVTALDGETFSKGDVVVDNAGKEYVYDGTVWAEFGSTTAADSAITALQGRMDTAESDIDDLEGEFDEGGRVAVAEGDIDALEGRMTKAESDISNNASAITALQTNKLDKSVYEAYINGKSMSDEDLKKYAENKADAAQTAAETTAASALSAARTEITAEIDADVKALKDGDVKANTDAIAAINNTETGILATAKSYADTKDATTLSAANKYTDDALKAAAANVEAGANTESATADQDIVVTADTTTGTTTVAHKKYGTGTYTKPETVSETSFVTGITVANGHVTGASVKSLAEALAAMEFILDGGSAATESIF